MGKKHLFLMVGPPGSGKSQWLRENVDPSEGIIVSRDEIRRNITKRGEPYFSHEKEVFAEYVRMIQLAIDGRTMPENVYCDATHINEKSRRRLLNQLDLSNVADITCIEMQTPLNEAIKRNSERDSRSKVPGQALIDIADRYEPPEDDKKYKMRVIRV